MNTNLELGIREPRQFSVSQQEIEPESSRTRALEYGWSLTVLTGPHQGERQRLHQDDRLLVGRLTLAQSYGLRDPYMSRFHFMLDTDSIGCRLTDVTSHNRTYVNNMAVSTIRLEHGDVIRAGTTQFMLTWQSWD